MYYLGSITAASGVAANNWTTGASGIGTFTIPNATKRLYLQPNSTGILFELGVATGATTTAARGAVLAHGLGMELNGPFPVANSGTGGITTVAIYNSIGGYVSVKVFGSL